jgi:hypothetical protein
MVSKSYLLFPPRSTKWSSLQPKSLVFSFPLIALACGQINAKKLIFLFEKRNPVNCWRGQFENNIFFQLLIMLKFVINCFRDMAVIKSEGIHFMCVLLDMTRPTTMYVDGRELLSFSHSFM